MTLHLILKYRLFNFEKISLIMVTASFIGILRTLAILILVYYAVKFLLRLFAPVIMQQVVKKAEQSFNNQQQQYNNQQYNNQQQPPVKQKEKPREKKKVGEYIDYEEID